MIIIFWEKIDYEGWRYDCLSTKEQVEEAIEEANSKNRDYMITTEIDITDIK